MARMIPCFGPPPGRRNYRLRPGAYAVLIRGDQALLTFQHAPEPEYQLPGGGIDPGESPLAALHREVREETGWTIGQPRWLGAYRRFLLSAGLWFLGGKTVQGFGWRGRSCAVAHRRAGP